MNIKIHPHARVRMQERGATKQEVIATVQQGEQFRAKFGRTGFRMNFPIPAKKGYRTKQLEVYGLEENNKFTVISIIVKYF
ncbi:MAG: hypothetical protein Q7S62_01700 [bacterium]|nr:hypothetical protein [bacterium]